MSVSGNSLLGLSFAELESLLAADGVLAHHAKQLWSTIHRQAAADPTSLSLSPPLAKWVAENIGAGKKHFIDLPGQAEEIHSSDGLTRKYLLRLADGQVIETVLMEYEGRFTACVSSQAGCAMGCVFCATGQMGFVRHLTAGEIVAQVLHVRRALAASHPHRRLRNLVLMGMGEPLHNYDAVMKAMDIVSDPRGCAIGAAHSVLGPSAMPICRGLLTEVGPTGPLHDIVDPDALSRHELGVCPIGLPPEAQRRWLHTV